LTVTKNNCGVNHLLNGLSKSQYQWFIDHSESVELSFGQALSRAHRPLKSVYFPITCCISSLSKANHQCVEVSLMGNEGMLGAELALGVVYATSNSIVSIAGHALRIDSESFLRWVNNSSDVSASVNRYLYQLMLQLAQTSFCNRFHDVQQRLARWLLMVSDRTSNEPLYLTHQFLATILGVRRSAVTIAARVLHQKELISYTRGQLCVLSRDGLKKVTCQCYFASSKAEHKLTQ